MKEGRKEKNERKKKKEGRKEREGGREATEGKNQKCSQMIIAFVENVRT